jgi:uncharacterized protein YbcI
MDDNGKSNAKLIAEAALDFQRSWTAHRPSAVAVVQSEGTIVITLQDALTPAEMQLAKTPEGVVQVQSFHRALFESSSAAFRAEIKRITGMEVREAAAEIEPLTGAVVHAFTSGTIVQVFLLANLIVPDDWSAGAATV